VGGPVGQPQFFNGAALLQTQLQPNQLLKAMLAIEQVHGRIRSDPMAPAPSTSICCFSTNK
jgi:2-amino-4-hydroxy-6-hydroxymethyldihydropteridine diphosphokinase